MLIVFRCLLNFAKYTYFPTKGVTDIRRFGVMMWRVGGSAAGRTAAPFI
jgi:hypothetical protein